MWQEYKLIICGDTLKCPYFHYIAHNAERTVLLYNTVYARTLDDKEIVL